MRRKYVTILGLILLVSLPLLAEELKLGKPIDVKTTTPIKELVTQAEAYLGKEVKITGEIRGVCLDMGCWIEVKDPNSEAAMQVKVLDGSFAFPRDAAGRKVTAQGRLEKLVLTKEQYIQMLEHHARMVGTKLDTTKIAEGKTSYRIVGQGAVIQ